MTQISARHYDATCARLYRLGVSRYLVYGLTIDQRRALMKLNAEHMQALRTILHFDPEATDKTHIQNIEQFLRDVREARYR